MDILLKQGTVYTMADGHEPQVCDIRISQGKIQQVGRDLSQEGCQVIDCTVQVVLPGLIDSHCHMGLFGTATGEKGVDGNENLSPNLAQLRGIDGLNPFDPEFEHAYTHGVTCVSTGPGSGNPISGTFCIMKTSGETLEDMLVREPSSMKMAFGENPKSFKSNGSPTTRMGTAAIIREALFKAQRYAQDKATAVAEGNPLPPFDMKLEALVPVVEGTLPVKAHAHRADDILTALRIAKEFSLDMSIEHCSEGHLIPNQIEGANGVIIGPLMGFPHKLEVANQQAVAGRIFHENGIKFAIMSDLPATHASDILVEAGMCIREGLPMIEGLKAITRYPAEILKIDHLVGTLEVGKDADIVVFTENPVEQMGATCVLSLIDGTIVHQI